MRVLIVEDEVRLARNIAQILIEKENYATDICHDGIEGLHLSQTNCYDLIILDLMLPGMHGLDILAQIRTHGKQTPVLILTACDTSSDIIKGLDAGGDDYLTKPFDIGELVARCKALIRRSFGNAATIISVGDLSVDTTSRKVTMKGKPIILTPMEYHTLVYLAMRRNQIVSKEELLEHLYDFNWECFSNVIEVYISSLRKKIDPHKTHQLIKTHRGLGYMLEG